jgi:hypothetical protein
VKLSAHAPAQRPVNKLVLPNPIQARETLRHNPCGVVISIADKVADLDFGIGQRGADKRFYLF